jgi:timeless
MEEDSFQYSDDGEDMMQEHEDPDEDMVVAQVREPKLDIKRMNELTMCHQNLGSMDEIVDEETGQSTEVFSKGENCLKWVQDLQRELQRNENKEFRPIAKLLGKWQTVEMKLVPLVQNYYEEKPLLRGLLKVLVQITMPVDEETRDRELVQHYNRVYKSCFLDRKLIEIFMSLLEVPIQHEGKARTDDDNLLIELVLTLFKNLLSIENPKDTTHSSKAHLHHLHEDLIIAFNEKYVIEMVILIAQDIEATENKDWSLLLLEIFDLLFRNQDPQKLAELTFESSPKGGLARRSTSSDGTDDLLGKLTDERLARSRVSSQGSSRHSRFGGLMFVNKQGFSGDRRQLITNPFGGSARSVPQARKRRRKNQELLIDSNEEARKQSKVLAGSSLHREVQQIVAMVASSLIDGYVPFMRSIKGEIRRESTRLEKTDTDLFYRSVTFCSVFYRTQQAQEKKRSKSKAAEAGAAAKGENVKAYKGFHSGPIFETLDMFTFRHVQNRGLEAINSKTWENLPGPIAMLKEMLTFLYEMRSAGDDANRKIATALQNKVFYERDAIELLPVLVSQWKPKDSTYEHLVNAVGVIHLMLKMLEAGSKGSMIVLSKKTKRKKKKAKKKSAGYDSGTDDDETNGVENGDDEEMVEMQQTEQEFDFPNFFKNKFINTKAVVMYTHLLRRYNDNSAQTNHHVNVFFHRLITFPINPGSITDEGGRMLGATYEPMLFQLEVLNVFNNVLQDPRNRSEKLQPLVKTIKRVVRDFFALTQGTPSSLNPAVAGEPSSDRTQNKLLFVEALFNKGRPHERCLALSTCYYGMQGSDYHSKEDEEFMDRAHDAGLTLAGDDQAEQNGQSEEDPFEGEAEFGEGEATFGSDAEGAGGDEEGEEGVEGESRSAKRNREKAEKKRKRKEKRKRMSGKRETMRTLGAGADWTGEEDTLLRREFPALSGVSSVFELLRQKLTSHFDNGNNSDDDDESARQRKLYTAKQIAKRVRKLNLLTGKAKDKGDGAGKMSGRQLEAMLVDTRAAVRGLLERRGPSGVEWLASCLERCMESRSNGLSKGTAVCPDWALVPVTEAHFAALETDEMDDMLQALQLHAPGKGAGEWMWRVGPEYADKSVLGPTIALLHSVLAEKDGATGEDGDQDQGGNEDGVDESESKREDDSDDDDADDDANEPSAKKQKLKYAGDDNDAGDDDDDADDEQAKPSAKKRKLRRVVDSDSDDE